MISAPEDYGLQPEQTLAHLVAASPPESFADFWAAFREEIQSLSSSWQGRVSAEGSSGQSAEASSGQVIIPSLRSVRVIARVTIAEDPPPGVVVALHGSEAPDGFEDRPEPWSERGLATLRLRVRGYPPSTLDLDDLRSDWISHRLGSPDGWIVRGAVGDVMQAVRCTKRCFGEDIPVTLYGESLGGGLAVMAAAQLTQIGLAPQRLVLGLPSLGDWSWRRDRYCRGFGERVNQALTALREDAAQLLRTLLLFDAALHAPAVTCPVLCKLAMFDDVVPAPSAAAIYNALGARQRTRLVVRYGHFEGGIADLRRHALFEEIHPIFADPRENLDVFIRKWKASLDPP